MNPALDADATPEVGHPLVVACGALAQELRSVLRANNLDETVEVRYLPANLHNRPERIVPELRGIIDHAYSAGRTVLVGYADCGTGGQLDALLAEFPGVQRLPGDHCYEFFTGSAVFAAEHAAELGTFFLTDFLAKHFRPLIWEGLWLDRHPELRDQYFGHYERVMLLSQTDDPKVVAAAREAADALGLRFEHRHVGIANFAEAVTVAIGGRSHAA